MAAASAAVYRHQPDSQEEHIQVPKPVPARRWFGRRANPVVELGPQPSGSFIFPRSAAGCVSPIAGDVELGLIPPNIEGSAAPAAVEVDTPSGGHVEVAVSEDAGLFKPDASASLDWGKRKGKHCTARCPELPPELVAQILSHAPAKDLQAAHLVSKAWQEAARLNLRHLAPKGRIIEMESTQITYFKRLDVFPSLETLCLEGRFFKENEFARFKPHGSARLKPLKALGLMDCRFKHPMSDLTDLQGLERLKLKSTVCFEDDAQDGSRWIAQLTQLTCLEMCRDCTRIPLPTLHFPAMTRLQSLSLCDGKEGSWIPHLAQVSCLERLQELKISSSMIDANIAESVGKLTQLGRLELSDMFFFDNECMQNLSGLTGLTRLSLRQQADARSELLHGSFSVISTMTGLQHLNLSGNAHVSLGLDFLAPLVSLNYLNLSGINFGERPCSMEPLSNLTALTALNLFGGRMQRHQTEFLSHLKLLRTLDLSHNCTGDCVAPYIADNKDLASLRMNFCQLSNVGLDAILTGCSQLKQCRVDGCWISSLGIISAVRKRPEVLFWGKGGEWSRATCLGATWLRKLSVIYFTVQAPGVEMPRWMVRKERSWHLTLAVSAAMLLFTIVALFAWGLFAFVFVFSMPAAALLTFLASPFVFFWRLVRGAFSSALCALPDIASAMADTLWLDDTDLRTSEDRLAEML